MSFTANVLRVLIASPSDLIDERKVAIAAVYEWNALHAEAESVVLLPVAWETHATPRSGVRPQAAINEQLVDKSDLLVGMFWTKLGTSTGVAPSGTVEEIERFILAGKPALLYFSKRPVDPGTIDAKQNKKLKEFKEAKQKNALVGSFDSLESLHEMLAHHLLSEVRLLSFKNARGGAVSTVAEANSTSDIADATEQVFYTPLASWSREDYEHAIFTAIIRKDEEQIAVIDEAYRNIAHYSEKDNASTWGALIEWARIQFGKGGQLKKLKTLAESNPQSSMTLSYLGRAYAQFSQYELAASAFWSAMQSAASLEDKAQFASDAIIQFHKAKNQSRLESTLAELRSLSMTEPSLESVLTRSVQSIVEAEKDEPFTIALLERHLELNPDDYDARFQLAFKQSSAGNEEISLHHYYKISSGERSSMAWNNIGASAEQLGLPARSVAAFTRAAEMDETIAMSNLGFRLLKIGFVELAREQCMKALKHSKPHPNVGALMAALSSVEESEQLRVDGILDGVKTQVMYLQKVGQAATREMPKRISEKWQGPDCALRLARQGSRIVLKGEFEREENLLSSLMGTSLGLLGSTAPRAVSKSKHSVNYTGQMRGMAVIGEVKHSREGETLLSSAGKKEVFMIFGDNLDEITIFEKSDLKEPIIQVIKRVD